MFKYDLGDGARLEILHPYRAAEFFAFVNAHRAQLSEWLLWVQRAQTLADARAFLQEGVDDFARDETPTVGIWQDAVMAGGIAFFPMERRTRSTELAYWLGESFSGRGLMTRAMRVMLTYLFEEMKINRSLCQCL